MLNDFCDAVYYISLQTRGERRAECRRQLGQHSIKATWIPAVDGTTIVSYNGYVNKAQAGCYLSHLLAVSQANVAQLSNVCVFEDDILLHPQFQQKFEEYLQYLPEDWDIFYMGLANVREPEQVNTHIDRVSKAFNAYAYIVNGKAFHRFIEIRIPANRKNDQFNELLQKELNCYSTREGLVGCRTTYSDLKGQVYNPETFFLQDNFDYSVIS